MAGIRGESAGILRKSAGILGHLIEILGKWLELRESQPKFWGNGLLEIWPEFWEIRLEFPDIWPEIRENGRNFGKDIRENRPAFRENDRNSTRIVWNLGK